MSASISRQAQETAAALAMRKSQVLPVSAQKGLVGKVKEDNELVEKSGLPVLETKLSEDIVPAKQALIREKVVQEIGSIVETTAATVDARLSATNAELKELKGMSGKNRDVIQNMMAKRQQDKEAYNKKLANLENTHRQLGEQAKILLTYLSIEAFDALIDKTRKEMKDSWTTHGLKRGMKTFFDGAMQTMRKVRKQTEHIKGMVEGIYQQFQIEHGLAKIKLESFALEPYYRELTRLYKEAEVFRNSPTMVMTEQHFVVKRFFITLVSRARQLFDETNKGSEAWSRAIMAPVFARIREHELTMDQRVENLKKINRNLETLNGRIAELEALKQTLESQQQVNQDILKGINQPLPANKEIEPGCAATAHGAL